MSQRYNNSKEVCCIDQELIPYRYSSCSCCCRGIIILFEGVIKVRVYCVADMLWIVYALEGICSVVLLV